MMVKNAGRASVKSSKRMLTTSPIISKPTIIRTGAVAQAGISATRGAKITAARKRSATTTAARPVRPPSLTPAALYDRFP
ncbi:hypothetical protein PTH_2360 [Pelotomaculum thermopropionicum SI]|uniref:Uncharacterized protein n=1 Tax=Pelotomaculum thermopropionicum (strain DSM 13744 / JCM 10971 / SI) TaxID=370438 RepID=A5CZQ0_PELTS|nr:hypothetical protein PTH_2360 [Pelotomaculum thermopropionicum SI]